jgi:hypothetical protein
MTLTNIKTEIKNWKLTKYKAINLVIGVSALLICEFVGRPIYRSYIYSNGINDFHFADTLGNTFGTITTLFLLVAILSNDTRKGTSLLRLGTVVLLIFELAHPLLGKPIDLWDMVATIVTALFCYILYNLIFTNERLT